jgi:hypothetical protein
MKQSIGGGIRAAAFWSGMTEKSNVSLLHKKSYTPTNGRLYSSG